jgi:DNA replication protein DnaC
MSAPPTTPPTPVESLGMLLRALRLPAFARYAVDVAQTAEREGWTYGRYLHHLAELEVEERRQRRIERLQRASNLPSEKTLATLDRKRLPAKVQAALATLCEGHFLARAENVLAFGLPGRGKTHLLCAIGHHLVTQGHSVLFVPTFALVQQLLAAKRDLRLEKALTALDRFDAVLLDDIGYVQQSREEMEVLFTFLAQRYERKSVMITSNLVFSAWDRIFKDPLTTAAAIDRLVHHASIIEMNGNSYRKEAAEARGAQTRTTTTAATTTATTTTTDLDNESGQEIHGEM